MESTLACDRYVGDAWFAREQAATDWSDGFCVGRAEDLVEHCGPVHPELCGLHPDEVARPGSDATGAIEFWDLVNRQDWRICGLVQQGMSSRRFDHGFHVPMGDASMDIGRHVGERLA